MRAFLAALFALGSLQGQSFYNYVGQVEAHSVLLAWGTIGPQGNTIGRASVPMGNAVVRIANRAIPATQNWLLVDGLSPDTSYPYQIDINGQRRGGGQVRTWPEAATHMCFFVIGDFGNGSSGQQAVASLMSRELQRKVTSDCPVRFVLTVGDNIYADATLGVSVKSGDEDAHWQRKFFEPYVDVLRQVPFLPTLGNHDGNGSENRADLATYLDNFFFPQNRPARWYTFTYAGLAQFFALDSTINSAIGPTTPAYAPQGAQSVWLRDAMGASQAPWKIPYFHNPVYNAGPRHGNAYDELKHWVELFERSGVKVVFAGHEHNFQFTNARDTGGITYVISGSGGELRPGDVRRKMAAQHIAGWAPFRQFLSVEIEGDQMRIVPLSPEPLSVVDRDKHPVKLPVTQSLH